MKYILIAEPEYNEDKQCKEISLTTDDYGIILDALYEQAMQHKNTIMWNNKNNLYSKECMKVAKKFERIFNEEK